MVFRNHHVTDKQSLSVSGQRTKAALSYPEARFTRVAGSPVEGLLFLNLPIKVAIGAREAAWDAAYAGMTANLGSGSTTVHQLMNCLTNLS